MALKRTTALLLAAILLSGAALLGRMLYSAREELTAAEQAVAQGDDEAADRHLRRAIAHYAPGNVWVVTAAHRLLHRAEQAQARHQDGLALRRYRSLRGALLTLRPFSPHDDLLPRVERQISALEKKRSAAAPGQKHEAVAPAKPMVPEQPHPGWTLIGLMGFLLWVGSCFALVAFGFNPDLTLLRGRFWRLLAAVACGLCLFSLGMCMA